MDISKLLIPELSDLRTKFVTSGFDIRFVGGCVRDLLWGKPPKDVDLCTDATPDQQIELYKKFNVRYVETGLQHGTISVIFNSIPYEITSLRIDAQCDGRHATVEYVTDWIADLSRRDFTINAMSIDFDGDIIDPFGGQSDLVNNVVRFVGNAEDRINEDYLRILRWFRFLGRMDFDQINNTHNQNTRKIISNFGGPNSPASQISKERVWSEIKKIISGPNGPYMILDIHQTYISEAFGLPHGLNYLDHAVEVHARTENPVTLMVALYGSLTKDILTTFKASKAEINLAIWLYNKWSTDFYRPGMYCLAVEQVQLDWAIEFEKLCNVDDWDIAKISIIRT
jgi:tRNA nucleotidyltransferase/poly(A) polymerase